MEQIDLNNKSLTELKALAYDQLAVREQAQQNLSVLNERIAELSKVAEEDTNKK